MHIPTSVQGHYEQARSYINDATKKKTCGGKMMDLALAMNEMTIAEINAYNVSKQLGRFISEQAEKLQERMTRLSFSSLCGGYYR
jgi:hypothetical protein